MTSAITATTTTTTTKKNNLKTFRHPSKLWLQTKPIRHPAESHQTYTERGTTLTPPPPPSKPTSKRRDMKEGMVRLFDQNCSKTNKNNFIHPDSDHITRFDGLAPNLLICVLVAKTQTLFVCLSESSAGWGGETPSWNTRCARDVYFLSCWASFERRRGALCRRGLLRSHTHIHTHMSIPTPHSNP